MDGDGFVTIVDRKRDVIMASGFSVFPSEVEDVLATHPAIAECAVVGVPHYYRGETARAYVVLRPGAFADEPELHRFCAAQLAAYKVPSSFEFRTDLPRNLLGKVLKRALRAEYESARARTSYDDPLPEPAEPVAAATPDGPDGHLVDELERLVRLHDAGALSDAEFATAKTRLLQ
jgi:long-chain acyl-CoA synthetase